MNRNKSKQYERVFSHFDENKDGKISPAELRLCLGKIGGEISESEAEAVVLLMDSDCDGLLGLEDFIRLVEGTEEEEKVKDLKEAFKMYEEMDDECKCGNGSSSITPRSLKRMLSRLGEKKSVGECESKPLEDYYRQQKKLLDFQEAGAPGETWQGLLAALHLQHMNAISSSQKLTA